MSSERNPNQNSSKDDTFKILVATDIHLGFDYNKKEGWFLNCKRHFRTIFPALYEV